jgi:hypothetical protein
VRLGNSNDVRNGISAFFLLLPMTRLNEVIRKVYLDSRQKVHIAYFSRFADDVLFVNLWRYKSVPNILYYLLRHTMLQICIFGFIQRYISVSRTCKSG